MPRMRIRNIALASLAVLLIASHAQAADDFADVRREVVKRHDQSVKALQEWIALPSIAAENLNFPAGAEYMAKLAREAGFQQVAVIDTDGKPGVFATLDAGAKKTVGLYFMYDVKQYDPAEWTSPPLEARIVDRPRVGKVLLGRGAVNQKGPEMALLAALHAIHGAGRKMPVNPRTRCRVLRHRIDQPQSAGTRRRGDVIRGVSVGAGEVGDDGIAGIAREGHACSMLRFRSPCRSRRNTLRDPARSSHDLRGMGRPCGGRAGRAGRWPPRGGGSADLVHELVVSWLVRMLGNWLGRRGFVFGSEAKYAVRPDRGRKPVSRSTHSDGSRLPRHGIVRVPPDIVVEVVSPSPRDERRDRIEKMDEYALFGVTSTGFSIRTFSPSKYSSSAEDATLAPREPRKAGWNRFRDVSGWGSISTSWGLNFPDSVRRRVVRPRGPPSLSRRWQGLWEMWETRSVFQVLWEGAASSRLP